MLQDRLGLSERDVLSEELPPRVEKSLQLVLAVDANVAAGRVVVVPVECPRDSLGPARRHGDRKPSAGAQRLCELRDQRFVVAEDLA